MSKKPELFYMLVDILGDPFGKLEVESSGDSFYAIISLGDKKLSSYHGDSPEAALDNCRDALRAFTFKPINSQDAALSELIMAFISAIVDKVEGAKHEILKSKVDADGTK